MTDYRIEEIDGLQLHHLYRAWLGEEIAPTAAGALAPRCVKDLLKERLFERRRDLFSDLSLVFMDTTSLSFCKSGETFLSVEQGACFRIYWRRFVGGYVSSHRPFVRGSAVSWREKSQIELSVF